MSEPPRVSIVTAVLNGARHVEQTIESVLGQTYRNIEYVIIDGGSTDGTLDIVRRYERSLAHWESRRDNGLYFAMNDGIARSTGDLVGIINSDDWYEGDALQVMVDAYLATDRQTILYGITRYHDAHGPDMILSYDHRKLPSRMINHPACFVPRAIYTRLGVFDTRYRIAADYEFLLRAYRAGVPFKHVEHIIANFRHGGFSTRNRAAQEVLRIRRDTGYANAAQYFAASMLRIVRGAAARLVAPIRG